MYDDMQPDNNQIGSDFDRGGDREGAMAKADLYKLANYSLKLFKKLQDEDQLEGWVQAKITKAADYVASVYHYLEYEMKISEYGEQLNNAEMMSEGRKQEIKTKLLEAKEKIKALKMAQAEKQMKSDKPKKVKEGMFGGDEHACEACGGSGKVMSPEREIPEELKNKVEKYNRRAKAFTAASHRIDRNKNGIPDHEEMGEDQDDLKKTGDSFKTAKGRTVTKTDTGIKHTRDSDSYSDEDGDGKSGKGAKTHAKSQSAAEKKERAPKQKQSPKSAKTYGMKDGVKFDNRDKSVGETYGQGVYAEGANKKCNETVKGKMCEVHGMKACAGMTEGGLPMTTVNGKKVPAFAADGKGKNDLAKSGKKTPTNKTADAKKAGPKKGVNPFAKKDESVDESVAGPKKCWPGHRKVGTQPGTGKNAGKRVNDCEKIEEEPNEGNAFGKAVRDAKADGVQKGEKFKVGGKEYSVKEAMKVGDKKKSSTGGTIEKTQTGVKHTAVKKDAKSALQNKFGGSASDLTKGLSVKSKKVDETTAWKVRAAALRENLEMFSVDQDMREDPALAEMMAMAAEADAEGFAMASSDPAKLDEFLQNMFALEDEKVDEGEMKAKMHDDAEEMSREKFVDKYGSENGEFWDNIMGDLEEPQYKRKNDRQIDESTDFERMKQFLTRLNG